MTKTKAEKVAKATKIPAETSESVRAPKKKKVSITLSVNDLLYKGSGETLQEVIHNFVQSEDFPMGAKTKMFITYRVDNDEGHILFPVILARRVLNMMKTKTDTAIELLVQKLERRM